MEATMKPRRRRCRVKPLPVRSAACDLDEVSVGLVTDRGGVQVIHLTDREGGFGVLRMIRPTGGQVKLFAAHKNIAPADNC